MDNRSDFNANGEKAVFFGAMYDLKNWNLPGFAIGASYVTHGMLNLRLAEQSGCVLRQKPDY